MGTRKIYHQFSGSGLTCLSLLVLLLLPSACGYKVTPLPPTQQPAAAQPPVIAQLPATEQPIIGQLAAGQPVAGSTLPDGALVAFFPLSGSGFGVELTQDKAGFSDASLKFEGTEVARLSIRDAANDPASLASFQNSGAQIATYPVLELSGGGTAILVANRFVVGVQSVASDFSAADRKYWLEQFDLGGLAQLK